jgi:tetratricopeptide (TPR) repeat protein
MSAKQEARLQQLIDAFRDDCPALMIELGLLYLQEGEPAEPALTMMGQAYAALARFAEARSAYERALEIAEPDRQGRIFTLLGDLCRTQLNHTEAESFYRRAIACAPTDATAFIYLGGMFAGQGRFGEAEALHRRATQCIDGCIDEAYLNLGFVLRAKGEYLNALDCFREALARSPDYEEAKAGLADMERVLFHFPEA